MRILITGASGFIGRHLVRRLVGEHELFALVRRLPEAPMPGVLYLVQDLSQPLARTALPARVDVIIHQAVLIDTAPHPDALAFAVNVVATWELLKYGQAAGVHTFVHASTGGVYGCRNQPFVERDLFNPMDLYSLTKAQAELAVQAAPGDFYRVVLRYFFPYGAGTPNPIPRWIEAVVTGAPLPVLRSGKPALNPLHINDAVEATVRSLYLQRSAVINIAGAESATIEGIARIAGLHAGRPPNLVWIDDEASIPYYRADLVADIQQMQTLLAFTPSISLDTGIAELVAHYSTKHVTIQAQAATHLPAS
jgi:UDP-glucose 4-epimerase